MPPFRFARDRSSRNGCNKCPKQLQFFPLSDTASEDLTDDDDDEDAIRAAGLEPRDDDDDEEYGHMEDDDEFLVSDELIKIV